MSFVRAMALLVLSVSGWLASGAASAQTQVSYCVQNTHTYNTGCFQTLAKAEAFMRDNTPAYKDLLKLIRANPQGNGTVKLIYGVENQPPDHFLDPVYSIGSDGMTRDLCPGATGSDPRFPYYCSSESMLVQNYIAAYLQNNANCTYSNIRVTGGFAVPFMYAYDTSNGGWLYLNGPGARRRLEYVTYCSAWASPPRNDFVELTKYHSYVCKAGFKGVNANLEVGTTTVRSPNFCLPTLSMPYITTRIKQCESCETREGSSASAATGNNGYRNSDFVWEGQDFSRSYNSVRDNPADAGLGGNWSHSFGDSLNFAGIYPSWTRGDGYAEFFEYVDSTHYKPKSHSGIALLKGADTAVPGSAYKLLRGTTTRWFDAAGRMLKLRSGGKDFQFQYCDTAGLSAGTCIELNALASVRSDTGRTLSFAREPAQGDLRFRSDGMPSSVISQVLADGQLLMTYHYDTQGRLIDAVPAGQTTGTHYLYAESNLVCRNADGSAAVGCDPADFAYRLTGVEDESGRNATYSYDAYGRVLTTERAGGVDRVALNYASSSSAIVTSPTGSTRTYGMTTGSFGTLPTSSATTATNGVTSNSAYTFSADWLTSKTVNGTRTDYAYNTYQQTSVTEGLTSSGAATSAKRVTQTDWDANLQLPTERRTYDTTNTLVGKQTYTYNTHGHVLTASSIDPATGATRTTTTAYCEQADVTAGTCPLLGLVTSINGPRTDVNDTTTYAYYPSDDATCATSPTTCPHRKGDLWMVQDALGNITETLKYDGAGRVLSVKDANGVVTDFEYHARGWLTARKVLGADNGSETDDQITRIDYFPTGLVQKTTLPDGSFTSYTYDAAHRLTDITDGEGNKIHYTLDNAGNRTKEETLGTTGTVLRTLSRVYNQLGQLKTHKDAYDHGTGYVYDANGNTDTVTDALSRVTDNDYDPLNRLTKTIQNVGGLNVTTQFKYDAQDNLTEVVDPKNLSTRYTYNGLGDLKRLESPDTGITDYTYDSAGNRKTQTDARGVTATYGYDALNRLVSVSYPDSSLNVGYSYDTAATACVSGETFASGRLSLITDGSGSTQYCYDRFGQMVRKVQTTAGLSLTVRYGYTKAGQLSSVTYPDGTVADYVRDGLGRTTEVGVTRPGGSRQVLLTSASYYPFGPASEWVFGNGRLFQRTLNQNYQPGVVQDQSAGGLSLGYEFDAVGNLVKLRNGNQGEPPLRRYVYDALNRLTESHDGTTDALLKSYGYDASGNRLSAMDNGITQAYTIAGASHRLVDVGGVARTYDNAGNTTAIGGTAQEFVYNDANRMGAVKQGGVTAMSYAYNGKGEQVRRSNGTNNSVTVYDEAGHWLGEYDGAGNPSQQVVWLDELPVGLIIGTSAANQPLHYVEADALGTPRVLVDSQRDVAVWSWSLVGEAFGDSQPINDADGDSSSLTFNLRFPGQRYDAATKLNNNYFRDYDAGVGRYVESDPIGLHAGVNTFSYVLGNSLRFIDPLGLETQTQCVARHAQVGQLCGGAAGSVLGGAAGAAGGATVCSPSGPGALLCAGGGAAEGAVAGGLLGSAIGDAIGRKVGEMSCSEDDDAKCARWTSDARRQYYRLVNKRVLQYHYPTRGRDAKHAESIAQLQDALRYSIRQVRLWCKVLPAEIVEWERAANATAPGY